MRRILLPLLFFTLTVSACSLAQGSPPAPTPVPTFTPAANDFILDEVSAAVGPALMGGMKTAPYQEYQVFGEDGNPTGDVAGIMTFQGVSSGNRETHTVEGHEVETLGVYLLMQDGDVQEIPVAITVDGKSFVSLPEQAVITTTTLTDDYTPISVTMTYASPFERGAMLGLVSSAGVTVHPNAVDWSSCKDVFCSLGQQMDDDYPDAFFLLTLRALQEVPDGWILFGFNVRPQWGETVNQLIVDIPEERQ